MSHGRDSFALAHLEACMHDKDCEAFFVQDWGMRTTCLGICKLFERVATIRNCDASRFPFSVCTWSPVRQVPHNSPGDTSGFGEHVWELQGHHPSDRSCAQKLWYFGGIGLNIDGTWLICIVAKGDILWHKTHLNPPFMASAIWSSKVEAGQGWAPSHDGLAMVIASEAMTLELVSKSSEHADQFSATDLHETTGPYIIY